jgi:phage shock protein A
MGIFKRMKDGLSSRANAAIDKATDPEKEVEIAIMELEEGRKKALQELIAYKATSKQMEQDIARYEEKAAGWEKKAMVAVKAGDDEMAKAALKEKKNCLVELEKIKRDHAEAAGHAVALNKSRKEFEVKLQILKLKKGTLATQLAAARSASGNAFGHDDQVWEKFERAEARIDEEAIETEVDAAMRGEEAMLATEIDRKALAAGQGVGASGATPDDALEELKAKMLEAKQAKQAKLLEAEEAKKKP